ncbi:unnamed protein product [Meganyctiphanes norvegica]|uniref:Ras GTPase-activating protein n=1 Tax=Meganyctiphanes norvegica TaxID=48144 RepID=A0AAV2RZJ1_MEGNR
MQIRNWLSFGGSSASAPSRVTQGVGAPPVPASVLPQEALTTRQQDLPYLTGTLRHRDQHTDDDCVSESSSVMSSRTCTSTSTITTTPSRTKPFLIQQSARTNPQQPTPSRLLNFFSRRGIKSNPLKRTKSVTKAERNKRKALDEQQNVQADDHLGGHLGPQVLPDPLRLGSTSLLRSSRSHESLLSSQNMKNMLDFKNGEVKITPINSSILGKENCFQMFSPHGVRYFNCQTANERDQWIQNLNRAFNPNYDHTFRTENSLKIFVLEAKHISNKRKYFCEVLLDGVVYAQTSSKSKGEICFWGESFNFESLPPIETITVTLYSETEKRKKKCSLVGKVLIPVVEVMSRSHIEKWHQVSIDSSKHSKQEPPSLRLRSKFTSIQILPLDTYSDFLQFVSSEYTLLCEVLEPVLSVKAKEDIATSLINIMQHQGNAKHFLADIMIMEIDRIYDTHLLFRGNSLASKAMEAFMKLVGEKYLLDTLKQVITDIVETGHDCEVDPMKISQISLLQKQQENLLSVVKMTWSRILNSHPFFPMELRECFCLYKERLSSCDKTVLLYNLISSSIFLRFLCPAILSPSLFNIIQEYPDKKTSRNLTLIAKTLQTLANFTKFQGKENYMEFMNNFIEVEQAQMRIFLKRISSPAGANSPIRPSYDGDIDLGKQLSLLHVLLCEATGKVNRCNIDESKHHSLNRLQNILDEITNAKELSGANFVQNVTSSSVIKTSVNSTVIRQEEEHVQKNIFCYNDPTVNSQLSQSTLQTSSELIQLELENNLTPRSSTLPRNAYLMGSAKKPAPNLNTADDYVLFSALESNQPRGRNPIGHCFSHGSLVPGPLQSTPIPVHSQTYHHSHKLLYRNIREEMKSHMHLSNKSNINELDMSQDGTDGYSIQETEPSHKGSQTSLSELSNEASSGYQSSSPLDNAILNNSNGSNKDERLNSSNHSNRKSAKKLSPHMIHAPLAFNNPLYHLNALFPSNSSPRLSSYNNDIPNTTQQQYPAYTLPTSNHKTHEVSTFGSSHSLEDLTSVAPLPIRSSQLQVNQKGYSSSTEELDSLASSPRDHYSSTTPRNTPRFQSFGIGQRQESPLKANHYHSTSDLLVSKPQRSEKKLQQNNGSFNNYESASGLSRRKLTRQESKSLEEYEREICALKSAMEDMQMKLMASRRAALQKPFINYLPADDVPSSLSQSIHHNIPDEQKPLSLSNSQCSISNSQCSIIHTNEATPSAQVLEYKQYLSQSQEGTEPSTPQSAVTICADTSMKELLHKIVEIREESKSEKQKMCNSMSEKDAVIQAQRDRIRSLDQANAQLLIALQQITDLSLDSSSELASSPQHLDMSNLKSIIC